LVMAALPPTLSLLLKGGGDIGGDHHLSPSPLKGEGWGGGDSRRACQN
jgi:hypothetical protein